MADSDVAIDELICRAKTGEARAWSVLVGRLQRDVGVFVATFASSRTMLVEVQRAAWSACRDDLAACPAAAEAADWVRQAARRRLATELELEARAAPAGDALPQLLANAGLGALAAVRDSADATARQLGARFTALGTAAQLLLSHRYGDGQALAALAAELGQEPTATAAALFAARAAADWTVDAAPATDALFAMLVEEFVAGTISADSRGVIAACLAKDPRRVAIFERQVRLDLMLGELLGRGDQGLAEAVALTAPKRPTADQRRRRATQPPMDAGPAPAADRGRRRIALIAAGLAAVGALALGAVWAAGGRATRVGDGPGRIAAPTGTVQPDGIAIVQRLDGAAFVLAEGHRVPAAVGGSVAAGNGLETGATGTLEVEAGPRARLGLGVGTVVSAVAMRDAGRALQAMLGQGTLAAEAGGPAGGGGPAMAVFTSCARVELDDGACTIAATAGATTLEVRRGTARLARADGSHAIAVAAGQRAHVAELGEPRLEAEMVFLRGIDLGGEGVEIAGRRWLSRRQALDAGLSIAPGAGMAPPSAMDAPDLDAGTRTMLGSGLTGAVHLAQAVPDGEYAVWLWLASAEAMSGRGLALRIGGQQRLLGEPTARGEGWWRLGPYPVTAAGGGIDLAIEGLHTARLAGLELAGPGELPAAVSLASPADGGSVPAGGQLALRVEVIGDPARVAQVEYFDGETRLGASTTPPFELAGQRLATGVHRLAARATDRSGAVSASQPATITATAVEGAHEAVAAAPSAPRPDPAPAPAAAIPPAAAPPPAAPVQTTAPPAAMRFLKGINLGGEATIVEGNHWLSQRQAEADGLAVKSARRITAALEPKPPGDAALKAMLDTGLAASNGQLSLAQKLPNGRYLVYAWVMETILPESRSFALELNGEILPGLGSLPVGGWAKVGPCEVTVADGSLHVLAKQKKGNPQLMGLAIYTPPLSVAPDGPGWKAVTAGYQAVIGADGCLTNLAIGGVEFLRAGLANSRGGYFYQDNPVPMTTLAAGPGDSVVGSCDRCTVRYGFRADGLTLDLTNTSGRGMVWFMIVDPRVEVATGDQTLVRTPIANQQWQNSVWLSGSSRLAISGTSKVWTWLERTCAVETYLEPGRTHQLVLSIGSASPEELKQAAAVLGR
jgi:hypothetical protein